MQDMLGGQGDNSVFILSIVFGIIGMFYLSYGKRHDDKNMFMYGGVGLMVFPYFVDTLANTILIGLLLIVVPFFLRGE